MDRPSRKFIGGVSPEGPPRRRGPTSSPIASECSPGSGPNGLRGLMRLGSQMGFEWPCRWGPIWSSFLSPFLTTFLPKKIKTFPEDFQFFSSFFSFFFKNFQKVKFFWPKTGTWFAPF